MEDRPQDSVEGSGLRRARKSSYGDEPTCEDIASATGSSYCYHYRELLCQASVSQIKNYCLTNKRLFAPIAKDFNEDENSRWILRHYLAIKFATSANLLAGSAVYAYDHNLLLAIPYFNYYTVLNACRAYLLTSPHVTWDGSKTVEMTHQNILNRTSDYLRALDPGRADAWKRELQLLRERRELFSYRFPLSGGGLAGREAFEPEPAISLARLIAELASLNSECLDASLCKHASENISARYLSDHEWASAYKLAGEQARDSKDNFRFSKLVSGWSTVSPLEVMCSDGLMDDIYGSWSEAHERPDTFNPDDCAGLILSL